MSNTQRLTIKARTHDSRYKGLKELKIEISSAAFNVETIPKC